MKKYSTIWLRHKQTHVTAHLTFRNFNTSKDGGRVEMYLVGREIAVHTFGALELQTLYLPAGRIDAEVK